MALKFLSSTDVSAESSADIVLTVERRIPLASVSSRYVTDFDILIPQFTYSLLYGQPYLLSNCTHEKFEWEELTANNEKFQAMCQILAERVLTFPVLDSTYIDAFYRNLDC